MDVRVTVTGKYLTREEERERDLKRINSHTGKQKKQYTSVSMENYNASIRQRKAESSGLKNHHSLTKIFNNISF